MKQFFTILRFELKNYFTNKVFVGTTLFLVVVLAAVLFFPRISQALDSGPDPAPDAPAPTAQDEPAEEEDRPRLLLWSRDPADAAAALEPLTAAFPEYRVEQTEASTEAAVRDQVQTGAAAGAFVLESPTQYTYLAENLSLFDDNAARAQAALTDAARAQALARLGVSPGEAQSVFSLEVTGTAESLGKDQRQTFFYTYVMIFALYMVIMLYGQMVASSVATEKSSRAMELLITSAKPVSMMFGKVLAACLAGLCQLGSIFGSALLFYRLNVDFWGENPLVPSLFAMPLSLFLYLLLFFLLGFLIYAFLFGAIGSTASKLEDLNTSSTPVVLLFVAGFLVVVFSMSSGSVDNPVMKICSFVPLTSPMAMFTRIAMSTVPAWEILVSAVLLAGAVVGIGVVAARIYRVGVLLYGNPPKPAALVRAFFGKGLTAGEETAPAESQKLSRRRR